MLWITISFVLYPREDTWGAEVQFHHFYLCHYCACRFSPGVADHITHFTGGGWLGFEAYVDIMENR
jgi:hypothetical protein